MEATKEAFFDKLNKEQQAVQIPYYLHEGEMYRLERVNRRWFVAFLIVLTMLFATNGAWIYYEMQFDTYTIEQDVDSGEAPAVVSGIGDAIYGQGQAESNGP